LLDPLVADLVSVGEMDPDPVTVTVDGERVEERLSDGDETVPVEDNDEEVVPVLDPVSDIVVDRVDVSDELWESLGLADQLGGDPEWVAVADGLGLGLGEQVGVADCLHDTVPLIERVPVSDGDTVRVLVIDE